MTQHINPSRKALIAYPDMDRVNYVLIENLRIKHRNLMYSTNPDLALPHLVLHPPNPIEKEGLVEKITETLENVYAFDFAIHYSVILSHLLGYKVVLIPMNGLHHFLKLQAQLCTNIFTKPTPTELMYPPYIHIAWTKSLEEARNCMNEINQGELEIKGRIDKLTLKEWEKDNFAVPAIHEFPLKSRP